MTKDAFAPPDTPPEAPVVDQTWIRIEMLSNAIKLYTALGVQTHTPDDAAESVLSIASNFLKFATKGENVYD